MLIITGSSLQDFETCKRYWYVKHILQRGEAEQSDALDFGIFWHKLCADPTYAEDLEAQAYLEGLSLPLRTAVEKGLPQWKAWLDSAEVETVAVEEKLDLECGCYTLRGQPDRIVRDEHGGYWHIQHKTLSGNRRNYTWKIARSWHEVVYQRLGAAFGYRPWKGTILACLEKLSAKAMNERGENPFSVEYVTVSDGLQSALDRQIDKILRTTLGKGGPTVMPPNLNSCVYGGGHWKTCKYLQHCEGLRSWGDLPQFNPLQRYEENNEQQS